MNKEPDRIVICYAIKQYSPHDTKTVPRDEKDRLPSSGTSTVALEACSASGFGSESMSIAGNGGKKTLFVLTLKSGKDRIDTSGTVAASVGKGISGREPHSTGKYTGKSSSSCTATGCTMSFNLPSLQALSEPESHGNSLLRHGSSKVQANGSTISRLIFFLASRCLAALRFLFGLPVRSISLNCNTFHFCFCLCFRRTKSAMAVRPYLWFWNYARKYDGKNINI